MIHYAERRRQLRQLEDQALAEGRLPPGQSLTVKWPVLSAGTAPTCDPQTWRFRTFGLVEEPRAFTWDEFAALPRVTRTSDIHCVTHWTKLNNVWEGVAAAEVIRLAGPSDQAKFVMVHAPGYSANLPLSVLLEGDVLFALSHDGEPLGREHGGPVRLVVPQRYFWKSVKWVDGLEFMADDRPGFWEERGYHMNGDPLGEERFAER